MREAIVILAVIVLLFGLTAFRYRRQLLVGYQIWKTLKTARNSENERIKGSEAPRRGEPMVKCVRCGSWRPESSAVVLGASAYCGPACVEASVRPGST